MITSDELKLKHPSLITFLGCSRVGKTTRLITMLMNRKEIFERTPHRILFFHKYLTDELEELEHHMPIEFIQWPPTKPICLVDAVKQRLLDNSTVNLLCFDDLQSG